MISRFLLFYQSNLYMVLCVLALAVYNVPVFVIAIRWLPCSDRRKRLFFIHVNALMGLTKSALFTIAMYEPMPEYPFLSVFLCFVTYFITFYALCGGFWDFTKYCFILCVSILESLPVNALIESPIEQRKNAYLLLFQEMARRGEVISLTLLKDSIHVLLWLVLIELLLLYLLIASCDFSTRKMKNESLNTVHVIGISSFVLFAMLTLISFIDVLLRRTPMPSSSISILVTLFGSFFFIVLGEIAKYQSTRLQLESSRSTRDLQQQEILLLEKTKARRLSYLQDLNSKLDELELEIREKFSLSSDSDTDVRIVPRFAENPIADIALVWCNSRCMEAGIDFSVSGMLPKDIALSAEYETAIYFNLLNNAYEAACRSASFEMPYIRVDFRVSAGNLLIRVANSYNHIESVKRDHNGNLRSTKTDAGHHGFGTKILRRIAEEHGGDYLLTFDPAKKEAIATVVLAYKTEN